jgi:hypothetical protein
MFTRHGSGEQAKTVPVPQGESMDYNTYARKYGIEECDEYPSSQAAEMIVADWGPPTTIHDSATQRREAGRLIRDVLEMHDAINQSE